MKGAEQDIFAGHCDGYLVKWVEWRLFWRNNKKYHQDKRGEYADRISWGG
jgi:hypothetical protein